MYVRGSTLAASVIVWAATFAGLDAQVPPHQQAATRRDAGHAEASRMVTFRGCLETAPGGTTFVLRNAKSDADTTPAAAPTTGTSPGAGTSATGTMPSGTITGDTPTGSTATSTSAPTPATGRPNATADPASPDYNRDVAAGASAGASQPNGPVPATGRDIAIVTTSGLGLRDHVGHVVEVTGRVTGKASAHAGSDLTAAVRAPERNAPSPPTQTTGSDQTMLTLDVHALLDVAANCSVQ